MKSRLVAIVIAAAVATFLLGGVCSRKLYPPKFLSIPDSVFAGEPAQVRVFANGSGYDSVCYVVNWDDGTSDTTGPVALTEAATASHVWTAAPNTRYVRAAVFPVEDPRLVTWGEQERVLVAAGGSHAPAIDTVEVPPLVMRGVEFYFTVRASDPDGDSIKVRVEWGDGRDTTSEFLHGPYYVGFYPTHTFEQLGMVTAVITAQDCKGATSLPETAIVRVDTTGGVLWYSGRPFASPLLVNDGVEDLVYVRFPSQMPNPGVSSFAALTKKGSLKYTARGDSSPSAGVAYCASTQHLVGGGVGLWALDRQLRVAWRCETPESSGWSDPAVSGDRIYLGNGDTLYCFLDSSDHGVRVAALATQGRIVGGPVVDAYDAVYFGTDSGFLYKVGPGLDTIWRLRMTSGGEGYSPVIGSNGTIYFASSSRHVYAVDAATGAPVWNVTLDGVPGRIALGQTLIFVGTDLGTAYSLNPSTGDVCWRQKLGSGIPAASISAAPAVAANGCVYFQNDEDKLYRVNQADGTVICECDCAGYLWWAAGILYPGKRLFVTDYPPNSTILPDGNVIVVGSEALYCVAGDPAGPLDPLAPWPKWQHDLHNTGHVGGGR